MKILVTGGTGFLGQNLVRSLLDANHEVTLLVRRPVQFLGCEILQFEQFFEAPELFSFDACVHAAGVVGYKKEDVIPMHQAHVELTSRLLTACDQVGLKRFIYISSIVALGCNRRQEDILRDESSVFNDFDLGLEYWTSKYSGERIVKEFNPKSEPRFLKIVLNPGTFLGVGKTPSSRQQQKELLVLIKKMAISRIQFVPKGGSHFIDVIDVVESVIWALESPDLIQNESFVLMGKNLTYKQLCIELKKTIGQNWYFVFEIPKIFLKFIEFIFVIFEKVFAFDSFINSRRIRRINGLYLFFDDKKFIQRSGLKPRDLTKTLRESLSDSKRTI